MTSTNDARAAFIRALDEIACENRELSSAEDRLLRLAFEQMLDRHYQPVATTLRGNLLDVKHDRRSEGKVAVVTINEWRRKLAAVH